MKDGIIFIVITACVFLTVEIISRIMYKKYAEKLTELLMDQRFEEFDGMIDSLPVRLFVYPFNRDYLKLSRHQLAGNTGRVSELFEKFKGKGMSNAQKKDIYLQAFNHYLSKGDYKECRYYHDEINKLKDADSIIQAVNTTFDIVVDKKTDMLDDLLKETEELPENRRGINEMLISQIYMNLGEKKKSQNYQKLANQHMAALQKELEEEAKEQ